MFIDRSERLLHNPAQLNYGMAVTDSDGDGQFEIVVAGFGAANRVLKWTGAGFEDIASAALADEERQAIGVAAADIDGDGREELYILNTDTFMGQKRFADRLFDESGGEWTDLFSLPIHQAILNMTAGRSVGCVDRFGTGCYGFFVANYGGPMRLYEVDEDGRLADVAGQANLALITGGRSVVPGPIIARRMDIFAGNEGGPNFLFINNGDGTFTEVAGDMEIDDPFEHARGAALLDSNGDGLFDIVVGNWEGAHRLYVQTLSSRFEDTAPPEMARPSRVRTVIAADFDNDGWQEIFFNNIGEPNRLFARRDGVWTLIPMGAALEPHGLGTGAVVGDFDGDGRLELLIAHGERAPQPLSLYTTEDNGYHWLRVLPLTRHGAPARGAIVVVRTPGRVQRRVSDAGSGYLCQMEPVVHFGLGPEARIDEVTVIWTDGEQVTLRDVQADRVLHVSHPHA
jgi:hypothetical protein